MAQGKRRAAVLVAALIVGGSIVGAGGAAHAAEDHTGLFDCPSQWSLTSNFYAGGNHGIRHTRTNGTYSQQTNDSGIIKETFRKSWAINDGTWRNWGSSTLSNRWNQCFN